MLSKLKKREKWNFNQIRNESKFSFVYFFGYIHRCRSDRKRGEVLKKKKSAAILGK